MAKRTNSNGKLRKKVKRELTLKDRLSRLGYQQACQLLGEQGKQLIIRGGRYEGIDIERDVYLGDDLFRLSLDEAVVTITLMNTAKDRLRWNCNQCSAACEHVGAALALILEEKVPLGLAAPPPERVPVESLSEKELVQQAIEERRERSRKERMRIKSTNARMLWTDYLVTSSESGKTYRVALRGWEPGDSYCSCPDFRKNTLGLCKHIFKVQDRARKKFTATTCRRPHRQTEIAVHLKYGRELELRLLLPDDLEPAVRRVVKPLTDLAIDDVHDLIKRLRKLANMGQDVTVYPDAEEYINQRLAQDRMSELAAGIRKNPARHPLRKELLKTELLPYQLEGIAFAAGAGRAILADDMGLGKTIQAIGTAELLARQVDIRKVLIICPASVKSQWQTEIRRFSDRDCQLVMGSMPQRVQQYGNDRFFTVCNYEQVLRDILAIEQEKWDLIVLDEGQRIKNWEAKTSRVIKGLQSPFALVLSGTPLENRLDDLYSVAEFVDDRRLGPAFRFFNRHRIADEKGRVLGYKNLEQLRRQLEPILLRRTRGSVMQDLPPRSTEIIRITPTDEQLELHRTHMQIVRSIVRKPYFSEMDLLRLQKALLMCRMSADSSYLVDKKEPGYSSKLEALAELIERLFQEEDRKVVLFSEWTTMLDFIEPILDKQGIDFVRLDGSVPQRQRQQLVHRFQKHGDCRVFLTTNAGSTGLNLQSANTVINVDLPWNPAVLEQRVGRAHRMGQKQPVQVFVLISEGTIEENLLVTLSAKQDLALAALDMESEVDQVDLPSGMEALRRKLEILLGRKPEAPLDQSVKTKQEQEAERLARQERLAAAGGQLLNAAVDLLKELMPAGNGVAVSPEAVGQMRGRLDQCVQNDEQGRPKLTLTLPDNSTLDRLAEALAGWMESGKSHPADNGR